MPRWALLVAGGAVVLALLVLALRPEPVPVDLAEVDRGTLRVTIDEEGRTRVRDSYVISAPVAGRLERVTLDPGDAVHAGATVVARLRPSDAALLDPRAREQAEARVRSARAALGRARAEREAATAERDLARTTLERTRRLVSEDVLPQEGLDRAVAAERAAAEAVAAADFAVRVAEHELEVARAALTSVRDPDASDDLIELRSPVEGTVLRVFRESEGVVPAGEPLVEVADTSRLEVVSDLLSTDAVRVRPGDQVVVERWGGGRALPAVVRRVEPAGYTKVSALGVEEQRVDVIIDPAGAFEAWASLGDGYRVEVRIVEWEEDDVLRVPTSSLFRAGEGWGVFVFDEGVARLAPVEVGHRNEEHAEVLGGLSPGAAVLVHPSDDVEDGARVEPRAS